MKALRWIAVTTTLMMVTLAPLGADDDRKSRTITSPPPANNPYSRARSYYYDQDTLGNYRNQETMRHDLRQGPDKAYGPERYDPPGRGRPYTPPGQVRLPAARSPRGQSQLPPGLHYSPTRGITPDFLGSVIVASDNTFLGVIDRKYWDPDSICNPQGQFGSVYSPYSIWNSNGRWGTKWGQDSPWNPNAIRPPKVFFGNYFWGYLSANRALHPRINPYWLIEHLEKKL